MKMRKETNRLSESLVHTEMIWKGISFGTFEKNQWRRLFEKGSRLWLWVFDWRSDNHFHSLMSLKSGVSPNGQHLEVMLATVTLRSWCGCCSLSRCHYSCRLTGQQQSLWHDSHWKSLQERRIWMGQRPVEDTSGEIKRGLHPDLQTSQWLRSKSWRSGWSALRIPALLTPGWFDECCSR